MCALKKFLGKQTEKIERERLWTLEVILKAVKLNVDEIGAIQEDDDIIYFGAGSVNDLGGCVSQVGLLGPSLEGSRWRQLGGRLSIPVAGNVGGGHHQIQRRSSAPVLIQQFREP